MLVDSSAWIEYLRATGSPADAAVERLIREQAPLKTCEPVMMELLAGARSDTHTRQLERLLARATLLPTQPTDWVDAARIYRTGRREGVTVRRLVDCLIAAIALRNDESILHHDVDFDAIARVTSLTVARD
ncbi:type II toxin-antitoxin system VapC family toxin [Microbacterium elymi]|uniref:Ribonuclease VapC n=1 Tax=Microbacterium elymi TaxID=2909587 RepID=A0ABY5NGR1_9MICO|nr:PIN domain nuclease [Microbacterium elymi]UUT34393.1 PIN domain nuclease [Microbacterium elymi]